MQNNLVALIKSLTEARATVDAASRENKILDNIRVNNIPNPFHGLPNVKHSWIIANVLDPLLCSFNLAKKLTPEMSFEDLSWRTKAANRYLRIMHYRLMKHLSVKDAHGYWILALMLMHKSKVIRLVAIRKLEPNFHLKMKFAHALLLIRQMHHAMLNLQTSLLVTREYASKIKPDGTKTFRPLGSPHKAHRMLLYIWQCFFVMFLYSYIGKYQHGFLPGRGVTTAWERTKRIMKLPYVWEFDLKGAFPSVNIHHTCDRMIALGVPAPIADYIRDMNIATIEMIPDYERGKLPEPKADLQTMTQALLNLKLPMAFPKGANIQVHLQTLNAIQAVITQVTLSPNPRFPGPREALLRNCMDLCKSIGIEAIKPLSLYERNPLISGFTQGSGLSPILFDFAFEDSIIRHFNHILGKNQYEIVAYADDFIISSKKDQPKIFYSSDFLTSYGLEISSEKSRNLRFGSLWTVATFKFLGLTYDANKGKIIGTPRSGSILEMDSSKLKSVRFFMRRDRQLSKFVKAFPQYANSTQQVLAGWGRNEHPFDLIPIDTITRGAELSPKILSAIAEEISRTTGTPLRPAVETSGWSGKTRRGRSYTSPTSWLDTPLAGTIMSRLHAGEWVSSNKLIGNDLTSYLDSSRTKGRSWYELLGSAQADHKGVAPTLHNSTSLATLDLLNQSRTRTIKLANRGAHYIKPHLAYIPDVRYASASQWHLERYPFMRMNVVTAAKLGLSPK